VTPRRWPLALRLGIAAAAFVAAVLAGELALEARYGRAACARDASAADYFKALGAFPGDTEHSPLTDPRTLVAPKKKEPGAFRVVVIGESTAVGAPYGLDLSFGALLAEGLRAAHPGRTFEVVHVAEPGRSSRGVVNFLDDALAAEPDVLVLYSGHNEFLQRLTQPSPFGRTHRFPWSWLPRLADAIDGLRDQGVQRRSEEIPASVRPEDRADLALLLRTLGYGNREVVPWPNFPIAPREREILREGYASNLERIAARARERGVPLVAIRPASQLRCAPIASGASFDPAAQRAFEAGEALVARDASAARARLVEARTLDPAPVRMPEDFGAAFDAAMRAAGATVIDADAVARRATGEALAGDRAFVDFMHPRETVHAELAAAVADALPAPGAGADAAFRARVAEILKAHAAEIAAVDDLAASGVQLAYLTYGNRAAAEAAGRALPEARRNLKSTLALDLALRWGGKTAEADATLARALERRPEWAGAIAHWKSRAAGIR